MAGRPHSPAAMIARIDRLALHSRRLERLRDVYTRELGAQASPPHQEPDSGRRAVFLEFCGAGLEPIEPPADPAPGRTGLGGAQIAFALGSADAVDRLTDRLAAAGHPVVEPPHRSWEGATRASCSTPRQPHRAHRLTRAPARRPQSRRG
jgi:lactoylglutathione lyase